MSGGSRAVSRGRILILESPGGPASLAAAIGLAAPHAELRTASGWSDAADALKEAGADLAFVDLEHGGGAGLELVEKIKRTSPSTLVLLTAASPSLESAIGALRRGAFDYLVRPIASKDLAAAVQRALDRRTLGRAREKVTEEFEHQKAEVSALRSLVADRIAPARTLGASRAMEPVYRILDEVCRTDSTVLITGESGTGKGVLARLIHARSPRAGGPFIEANCPVYAPGVLQSELFGHEAGAFTSAMRQKKGRIELARGGTLFLDEVGELSQEIQVLLLRFLQEHRFERVGGEETIEADVRVVAATNRDLHAAMRAGSFRSDLFYRLNVVPIPLAPLRERREDIPLLAERFLREGAATLGRETPAFTPEALDALTGHDWPGNVRELENLVERTLVLTRGSSIGVADLPAPLSGAPPAVPHVSSLASREREHILEILRRCRGNKKKAARDLGIHRSSLYSKLRRYGITAVELN